MTVAPAAPGGYAKERADLLARPGLSGSGRRRALSDLSDTWLAQVFADADGEKTGAALVAVGGYGRRELSPGSDLDLLLLVPSGSRNGPSPAELGSTAERIWYPVWDSGVRLDHSVRTVAEARRVAAEDLRALLGLLDARHVAGDPALTEQLRAVVLADWRAFARKRLPDLLAMGRERAHRSGDLAFSLEPDLKEARGGLRDVVALRAVVASWVADAPHERIQGAHTMLLDTRDALHVVAGRATDRVVQQDQPAIAREMGLLDADTLLRKLSAAGRAISYASDLTWSRVERAVVTSGRRRVFLTGPKRFAAREPLADGVVEQYGEVVLARDARPAADPTLVLRAAAASAQAGLRLAPHAVERLAKESAPMPLPWPQAAREALVSLLGAGPGTLPVWEALDQAELTVRLLPDWERVRFRPQRHPVHRFTVDRHLVETAVHASALTRRVDRPDLLLAGALLHDLGKGWPGDHTQAGIAVVSDLAPRMGFDAADTKILIDLVRLHLLLPETATRRDLDDPATVASVAAAVRTTDFLDLLFALTEADALATGPAAWSEWRAALVKELVERTRLLLTGHEVPPPPTLTHDQKELVHRGKLAVQLDQLQFGHEVTVVAPDRVGLLALVAGVLSLNRLSVRAASTATVGSMAVQVWSVLPEYGDPPAIDRLREDVRRALEGSLDVRERLAKREESYGPRERVTPPPPRVDVVPGASEVATVLEVRAHDRPALLYRIGSALAAAGADVTAARVSTLGSDAVDVFYVVSPDGAPLDPGTAAALRQAVVEALQ